MKLKNGSKIREVVALTGQTSSHRTKGTEHRTFSTRIRVISKLQAAVCFST
jgi:hypothetical protein